MALLPVQPNFVSKKTGTVVKYLRDTANPGVIKKLVNVGPNAKSSKISRSELTFKNGQPQELKMTSLETGEPFKFVYKKIKDGWKRIFS